MSEDGFPAVAPALPGRAIFDQLWCDLAFLHWPVEASEVARFMPPHVRPDVFEGRTYVGLVPFRMQRAGFGTGHPIPYFGHFLEWNVRLYSVDAQGRHGVVFRTLDATRLAVVAAARWGIRVPYVFSRMRADPYVVDPAPPGAEVALPGLPPGSVRRWSLARRFPGPVAASRLALRVGDRVEPTPLETFLTARWGMHSRLAGRTIWVPNEHGPWPLHAAEVVEFEDSLVAASGVRPDGAMLRPLWSPGVHARFARPLVVG